MKNVLIVEDDENKRLQLIQLINEISPEINIRIAKSFHSGLQIIVDENHDLILLDMTMPTYDIGQNEDGGRPQHYAGREILRQMARRRILTPVVVVTQFDVFGEDTDAMTRDQLDLQLHKDYPQTYIGTVYYNAAMSEWKHALKQIIRGLVKGGKAE
jgi:CheY-like chemotaxis protein